MLEPSRCAIVEGHPRLVTMDPAHDTLPTAVLIHGGHAGAWVWDDVRRLLACPSLAVDLPGHGARAGQLRGLRVADCLDAIVGGLPATGRLVVVGHGLGTAIALALASRVAARLVQMVLIAGPVPAPGSSILSAFPLPMRVISRIGLAIGAGEFSLSPRLAKATLVNGIASEQGDAIAARFTAESASLVLDPVTWDRASVPPLTYVQCLRDRGPLSPTRQARLAQRLGRAAELMAIDACHYVMIERPAVVAELLNSMASSSYRRGLPQRQL
jgi:pimeloyl-ACP methyl ester carboxylesterase